MPDTARVPAGDPAARAEIRVPALDSCGKAHHDVVVRFAGPSDAIEAAAKLGSA